MSYYEPIILVVFCNTLYQICAKSVPGDMNPFASLSATYLVGAVFSVALYYLLDRNANLIREYSRMNWAPIVLGLVIVGLEVGYIYAYRVGWTVSTAQLVQSAILAAVLILVGLGLYQEKLTWNKVVGILICLIGLGFINK